MMGELFSSRCNKCSHEYVIGAVTTLNPPEPDNLRFCVHCGSSNTVVFPEENVLKSNPSISVGTTTMTASEVRERNANKAMSFGQLYGMGEEKFRAGMRKTHDDMLDSLNSMDMAELESKIAGYTANTVTMDEV